MAALPAALDVIRPARRFAALLLMAASGFAALGYQIVWTQQTAVWSGHESAAVLAIVAAFFGGLALGALLFGQRIEHSTRPLWWYAGCEGVMALWALVLIGLMPTFASALPGITGELPTASWQWTVTFIATFVVLLPATSAMGATLPAIERVLAQWHVQGRSIAALYAANTFGAVLGVLATAFVLIPAFGLVNTTVWCAALNVLSAAAALFTLRPTTHVAPLAQATPLSAQTARQPALSSGHVTVLCRLALTGLLGIGYEVMVVRVLSQVTENTVYTFALLLAVYLSGTALGAAAYHVMNKRRSDLFTPGSPTQGDVLLTALAMTCLLGSATLWGAEHVHELTRQALGFTFAGALGAEAVLALLAFGLPTLMMGALYSHLATSAHARGVSFGRALGINTLGAAAAPLLFGVLIAPAIGSKPTLALIAVGYLALVSRQAWRRPMLWLTAPCAAAIAALALFAPPLFFIDVPRGGQVISYRDGVMAAVSVVQDDSGVMRLRINNRQQEGSNTTLFVDGRQGLLPLLLHPAPQRALFLGLGTGVTATVAAQDPATRVDAVELLPEVLEASRHFQGAFGAASNVRAAHAIVSDARRFVRAGTQAYDVIVSDNFHPARSGSGALYSVEHFKAVRGRLAPQGVFCQWLPLHQLDSQTLRSIVQSFLSAFPTGSALLASNSLETPVLGLVGRADNGRFKVEAVRQRLQSSATTLHPAEFGFDDEFAVLGSFVASAQALTRFSGAAPANTDDRPVVAYAAAGITYEPNSLPRDRLVDLLQHLGLQPDEILTSNDRAWNDRLAAYWAARDRYIEAGRMVRPSSDVRAMLAQVREPLLAVLAISPDFRPAYDPLLRMATALSRSDPADARALALMLVAAQPARPEAAALVHQLSIDRNDRVAVATETRRSGKSLPQSP